MTYVCIHYKYTKHNKKQTKNQDYAKGRKEPSGRDRETDNRDLF